MSPQHGVLVAAATVPRPEPEPALEPEPEPEPELVPEPEPVPVLVSEPPLEHRPAVQFTRQAALDQLLVRASGIGMISGIRDLLLGEL